jgi:hypothetical protein
MVPMPTQSGGPPVVLRGQFNRTFVVGLAGGTIASLELLALSPAGSEIRDGGPAKLKASSDCVSGRQPIAGTFRSDIDVIGSTYRQSSSTIVRKRETGSEPKNQHGHDLAAKGAFPARIRGGARLHAIVGAGAVGG